MDTWAKPNDFFSILRCTTNKYAKKLLNNGSIKFNTPQSWVVTEEENGKGRGDSLEGVFAACHMLDIESVIFYSKLYDDVYAETIDGLTYFRRKRTMNLPCYCFFLLKLDLFDIPREEGLQKLSTKIGGEYFRDFAGNIPKNQIDELKEEEKQAQSQAISLGYQVPSQTKA